MALECIVISRSVVDGDLSDLPCSTRMAWLAILFEAERYRGTVRVSARNLARMASITTEEATTALEALQLPRPYPDYSIAEGRKLIPVEDSPNTYKVAAWDRMVADKQAYFNRRRQQRFRAKITNKKTCDCCGADFPEQTGQYAVSDHNHTTGALRGMVCPSCNRVIGMIENGQPCSSPNVEAARAYIRRYAEVV